jgi:hypothetical protein
MLLISSSAMVAILKAAADHALGKPPPAPRPPRCGIFLSDFEQDRSRQSGILALHLLPVRDLLRLDLRGLAMSALPLEANFWWAPSAVQL